MVEYSRVTLVDGDLHNTYNNSIFLIATATCEPLMEFLEEEARPRFVLHSRPSHSQTQPQPPGRSVNKRLVFLCASLSISLLLISLFLFTQSDTLTPLLLWFSLSLLLGPFAPPSLTAGDIRVGRGKPLQPQPQPSSSSSSSSHLHLDLDEPAPNKPFVVSKRNRARNHVDPPAAAAAAAVSSSSDSRTEVVLVGKTAESVTSEEKQWTDQDHDLLKKQMQRHPVGEPKRWELVAEAFRGRHKVDTVIRMGKSMAERRPGDGDSFSQFLKQRKPLDDRVVVANQSNDDEKPSGWSAAEDLALLNALKAFPKEVSMRWEKIAAAVPGRSKAACVKRVAQLKKDFRSSKGSTDS
ncbi:hypothetical protein Sjap_010914 [Stephania japonica]|uniref:Myb-like domain-containing protein n=1 Tax=Stephania japonica TaxID=461633 RepID=A0AAP0JCI9_9MAGN